MLNRRQLLAAAAAGALARPLAAAPREVLVLGAGLAGLAAASLLAAQGHRVTVLEGRRRVGGRVLTLDAVPGHPEAGANVIGPNYGRVLDAATRLRVPLRVPPANLDSGYAIDGHKIPADAWADSPFNPLAGRLRAVPPARLLGPVLRDNPVAAGPDWCSGAHDALEVAATDYLGQCGYDAAALALVDANNSYGNRLADTSMLSLLRVGANFGRAVAMGQPVREVAAGNMRLPEALAASLPVPPVLGARAVAVRGRRDGVEVTLADGRHFSAEALVCTLPVPALRGLRFEPALPAAQREALVAIAYHKVVQGHFLVREPYWADSGEPAGWWTNGPLGRLFVRPLPGGERYNLTVWVNGDSCDRYRGPEAAELLADDFFRFNPAARGRAELRQVVRWAEEPLTGGSWALWGPGQVGRYFEALQLPGDRLFFAGEHTARANPGMEGAMESGERAALEVMRRLA